MNGKTRLDKKEYRVVWFDYSETRVFARSKSDAETLARAERIKADLPSSVRVVEEVTP